MTREDQMNITMLEIAKSKEKQFKKDLERLKNERPQNKALISQKEGYLVDVKRQIQVLLSKMK